MDNISLEAEVFFTRLIMKADDYGTYYANVKLLKAALYPLKDVTRDQIRDWMMECIKADLIFMYEVEGKGYIRIKNFGQRLQNMRNAFPHPPEKSPEVTVGHGESPTDIETKQKQETETKQESEPARVEFMEKKDDVPRGTKPLDKLQIFEMLFTDELYVENLSLVHKGKDFKQAFEECYIHHSNAPNPPRELHEWKQKLNTWLINTKNGNSKKTDAVNGRRAAFAKRHSSGA